MDALDTKLNDLYAGRVVRKDLVQKVKKGTNVPTFVLEFLLAKYCASNDPDEIKAGIEAVFEYLGKHYVRPDRAIEPNRPCSKRALISSWTRCTFAMWKRRSGIGRRWRISIRGASRSTQVL